MVLPQANPLGGAQVLFRDKHVGRFHLPNAENHNRGWELLTEDVVETIGAGLGPDAPANVALIRRVVGEALAAREPVTVLDRYRKAILELCYDADMVWDLHCDDDSGRHLFIIPEQWPDWQDIAAASRSMVALTAADSGGGSFDECLSTVWTRLQARFPEHPIPLACPSATFEYAGWADVEDSVAAEDAQHLFSILCSRGFVDAEPAPLPELEAEGLPLEATEMLRISKPGIIAYHVSIGDKVRRGQHVAERRSYRCWIVRRAGVLVMVMMDVEQHAGMVANPTCEDLVAARDAAPSTRDQWTRMTIVPAILSCQV